MNKLPEASSTKAGIVTTGTQSFSGDKTMTSLAGVGNRIVQANSDGTLSSSLPLSSGNSSVWTAPITAASGGLTYTTLLAGYQVIGPTMFFNVSTNINAAGTGDYFLNLPSGWEIDFRAYSASEQAEYIRVADGSYNTNSSDFWIVYALARESESSTTMIISFATNGNTSGRFSSSNPSPSGGFLRLKGFVAVKPA